MKLQLCFRLWADGTQAPDSHPKLTPKGPVDVEASPHGHLQGAPGAGVEA